MFTPSPITSWSCTRTSPRCMPMRCCRAPPCEGCPFASAANWRCIASAHATAWTALVTVSSRPSPVVFMTWPSKSAQSRRISAKSRCSSLSVPTSSECMRALKLTTSVKTMAASVRWPGLVPGAGLSGGMGSLPPIDTRLIITMRWAFPEFRYPSLIAATALAWGAMPPDVAAATDQPAPPASTAIQARQAEPPPAAASEAVNARGSHSPRRVYVIPIRDEIAEPGLFVLRRGLKEAVAEHADAVILDINTPGGAIDVTMEMMNDLKKFPGRTIAFVDNEAMSAGAFISAVCDEIWFVTTPTEGIIGAAAPVQGTGQDIDATMKAKLVSYLKVRMRAISQGKGHRGEVISAMIDADMELRIDGEEVKIDGKPIKEKGALLSLTATEAMHP